MGNAILKTPSSQYSGWSPQYPPWGVVLIKAFFIGFAGSGRNTAVISTVAAMADCMNAHANTTPLSGMIFLSFSIITALLFQARDQASGNTALKTMLTLPKYL